MYSLGVLLFLFGTSLLFHVSVLTVPSWPAYRLFKRKVRWSDHLLKNFPQFIVINTVKGFAIVNKAEIDIFLELSCFFNDPADVGNLVSGSSDLFKSSSNIWQFLVHVLLKPGLENFEHYFASMWDECNCVLAWYCLFWDWDEKWLFPVLWSLLSFPNLLAYWMWHFHSIIF